ncbi:proteasome activator pa28, REG alpha/beta subunit [Testicularia cyperi]|uniref:Proteasome activator pa28, REG alpha/beta subunit n=1 Tax=Testicularia cyperi TaxID=1882483 RepID=A0A317XI64_9BASI|nr:proteasome activator pa28, REG alpha/beta subunit [Testicularia cyperi]
MSSAVRLQFDQSTTDAIEVWQEGIRAKAVDIIQTRLPAKILSLNQKIAKIDEDKANVLSKTNYFDTSALDVDTNVYEPSSGHGDAGVDAAPSSSKKRKTTDSSAGVNGSSAASNDAGSGSSSDSDSHVFRGVVKASEYFANTFEELRAEWDELVELMDALKMYINLQMPQIEDGDTFGVSVQEEALNEVVRTQDAAYNLLATPITFHTTRGDLAAKLVRYPGIQDYREALREHDRKTIYRLRMQITDVRNMYAVVFDILKKNIAKISKPKSGNQMGSYG